MISIFIRRSMCEDTDETQGRRRHDKGDRDGSDMAASQGMPEIANHHHKLARDMEGFFMALTTL